MLLRKRRADLGEDITPQQLRDLVGDYKDQNEVMLSAVRILCYFIKDFTFDIADINSDGFKKKIDELVDRLKTAESAREVLKSLDAAKKWITDFIEIEREYLSNCDTEMKKMVDMLRDSLKDLVGEDQVFTTRMEEQNARMGKLLQLDDIRQLKQGLSTEIDAMRQAIQTKQACDSKRIEKLSKEVEVLRLSVEEYKTASMMDALTGASNRLAFDTFIRAQMQVSELRRKPLCMLMCDLDDFKKLNDTLGHRIGDVALQTFARECQSVVRDSDMVARYGGEEFALILPGSTLKVAQQVAQRIRDNVAVKRYICKEGDKSIEFKMTVSIGAAELDKRDTLSTFVSRADKALYFAKQSGKNCVKSETELKAAA